MSQPTASLVIPIFHEEAVRPGLPARLGPDGGPDRLRAICPVLPYNLPR